MKTLSRQMHENEADNESVKSMSVSPLLHQQKARERAISG